MRRKSLLDYVIAWKRHKRDVDNKWWAMSSAPPEWLLGMIRAEADGIGQSSAADATHILAAALQVLPAKRVLNLLDVDALLAIIQHDARYAITPGTANIFATLARVRPSATAIARSSIPNIHPAAVANLPPHRAVLFLWNLATLRVAHYPLMHASCTALLGDAANTLTPAGPLPTTACESIATLSSKRTATAMRSIALLTTSRSLRSIAAAASQHPQPAAPHDAVQAVSLMMGVLFHCALSLSTGPTPAEISGPHPRRPASGSSSSLVVQKLSMSGAIGALFGLTRIVLSAQLPKGQAFFRGPAFRQAPHAGGISEDVRPGVISAVRAAVPHLVERIMSVNVRRPFVDFSADTESSEMDAVSPYDAAVVLWSLDILDVSDEGPYHKFCMLIEKRGVPSQLMSPLDIAQIMQAVSRRRVTCGRGLFGYLLSHFTKQLERVQRQEPSPHCVAYPEGLPIRPRETSSGAFCTASNIAVVLEVLLKENGYQHHVEKVIMKSTLRWDRISPSAGPAEVASILESCLAYAEGEVRRAGVSATVVPYSVDELMSCVVAMVPELLSLRRMLEIASLGTGMPPEAAHQQGLQRSPPAPRISEARRIFLSGVRLAKLRARCHLNRMASQGGSPGIPAGALRESALHPTSASAIRGYTTLLLALADRGVQGVRGGGPGSKRSTPGSSSAQPVDPKVIRHMLAAIRELLTIRVVQPRLLRRVLGFLEADTGLPVLPKAKRGRGGGGGVSAAASHRGYAVTLSASDVAALLTAGHRCAWNGVPGGAPLHLLLPRSAAVLSEGTFTSGALPQLLQALWATPQKEQEEGQQQNRDKAPYALAKGLLEFLVFRAGSLLQPDGVCGGGDAPPGVQPRSALGALGRALRLACAWRALLSPLRRGTQGSPLRAPLQSLLARPDVARRVRAATALFHSFVRNDCLAPLLRHVEAVSGGGGAPHPDPEALAGVASALHAVADLLLEAGGTPLCVLHRAPPAQWGRCGGGGGGALSLGPPAPELLGELVSAAVFGVLRGARQARVAVGGGAPQGAAAAAWRVMEARVACALRWEGGPGGRVTLRAESAGGRHFQLSSREASCFTELLQHYPPQVLLRCGGGDSGNDIHRLPPVAAAGMQPLLLVYTAAAMSYPRAPYCTRLARDLHCHAAELFPETAKGVSCVVQLDPPAQRGGRAACGALARDAVEVWRSVDPVIYAVRHGPPGAYRVVRKGLLGVASAHAGVAETLRSTEVLKPCHISVVSVSDVQRCLWEGLSEQARAGGWDLPLLLPARVPQVVSEVVAALLTAETDGREMFTGLDLPDSLSLLLRNSP